MSSTSSFVATSSDVERYKRLRQSSIRLNQKIVTTIPKEAMYEVGDAIGILHKGKLVFETEDESSVLMDCCLYDWIQDGQNLVQKYAESHPAEPGTDEHELLRACRQAEYRIVVPQSRVPGAGAYVTDLLSDEQLFIMDTGFSQSPLDVAFATRIIPLGPFWMTGGAGLPAGSAAVKKVLSRLSQRQLVVDRRFTNPHKAALLCVRTLLESGASRRIKYHTVEAPPESGPRHARDREPEKRIPAANPGRNSPCPCGSGKRYKRCCGSR